MVRGKAAIMPNEKYAKPRSEPEEIRRRTQVTIRELVDWYKQQGISLDVPLTDYESRGTYGESS
jgi:hypothetical protein